MIQTSEKPNHYLWCISGNLTSSGKRMYYLGGTTAGDPYYTHSSHSSEEFRTLVPHGKRPLAERKEFFENPPKGISRRILEEFDEITEENNDEIKNNVWKKENKLLVNRKECCWDRYYNESVGNPGYIDMSGKNNPNYKDGMNIGRVSPDREVRRLAELHRDHNDPKRIEVNERKHAKYRAKMKALTGYSQGYSQKGFKQNRHNFSREERYGVGKLDQFFE